MKCALLSVKPQFVAKILNKEKTIEVRKRFPKDYVGWVYIYCTKARPYIKECDHFRYIGDYEIANKGYYLNGKVVARFWCDKVEKIRSYLEPEQWYMTSDLGGSGLLQKSCLTFEELDDYLLSGGGYAIHITKLEIFDKPKEINEFSSKIEKTCICFNQFVAEGTRKIPLTRAPQSWCYIEV